ncbi:hypothetical protein VUR80DRAFT_9365 [Thermomyces stellatus]
MCYMCCMYVSHARGVLVHFVPLLLQTVERERALFQRSSERGAVKASEATPGMLILQSQGAAPPRRETCATEPPPNTHHRTLLITLLALLTSKTQTLRPASSQHTILSSSGRHCPPSPFHPLFPFARCFLLLLSLITKPSTVLFFPATHSPEKPSSVFDPGGFRRPRHTGAPWPDL